MSLNNSVLLLCVVQPDDAALRHLHTVQITVMHLIKLEVTIIVLINNLLQIDCVAIVDSELLAR